MGTYADIFIENSTRVGPLKRTEFPYSPISFVETQILTLWIFSERGTHRKHTNLCDGVYWGDCFMGHFEWSYGFWEGNDGFKPTV